MKYAEHYIKDCTNYSHSRNTFYKKDVSSGCMYSIGGLFEGNLDASDSDNLKIFLDIQKYIMWSKTFC